MNAAETDERWPGRAGSSVEEGEAMAWTSFERRSARGAQKLAHSRAALDIVDSPRSVESADYRERHVIWSYDLPARSLPVLAGFRHSASACAYR